MSRSIPLKTIGEVRHEMSKVYREARNGKLEISDASKLSYMLKEMGKIMELELDMSGKGNNVLNWTNQHTIYGMNKDSI